MKRKLLLQTCLATCLITVLGFFGIIYINCMTFNKVSNENIENIARLTSSIIYAEIDNDLTKPIYVSQTMANDTFLKEWINNESDHMGDKDYQQRLINYLYAFRNKYNYDSAFVVSAKSNVYYHFQGINKTISPIDAHDVWYYDFLNSGKSLDLDVDFDEADKNELTVFVNCKIEDAQGQLLGVAGVGVKMSQLQQLLRQYELDFGLEAFLINPQGDVQIHTDTKKIEQMNFFDLSGIAPYKNLISNNKKDMEVFWYPKDQLDHCIITRYIDNLDWYLIVEKDNASLLHTFQNMITNDILIAIVILLLIMLPCIYIVQRHDRIVTSLAATDELTGLPNRKWFDELLHHNRLKYGQKENYLFIMDIDHFKSINDTMGHLYGDQVLHQTAGLLKEVFSSHGIAARWGGDEFIGIVEGPRQLIDEKWLLLLKKLAALDESSNIKVNISLGITAYDPNVELDSLIGKADVALYNAKKVPDSMLAFYEDITS